MGAGLGGMPAGNLRVAPLTVARRAPASRWSARWTASSSRHRTLDRGRWRERGEITLRIGPLLERRQIGFTSSPVQRIDAQASRLTLADGRTLDYDYLVITTGAQAQLRRCRVQVLTADTRALGLHCRSRRSSGPSNRTSCRPRGRSWSAPCRARATSGRLTSSPSSLSTDLRRRKLRHLGADHLRDQRVLHWPHGPGRGRRQQGHAREQIPPERHQVGHQMPGPRGSSPASCTRAGISTRTAT